MLMDVQDLRANNWVQRRRQESILKTINQVRGWSNVLWNLTHSTSVTPTLPLSPSHFPPSQIHAEARAEERDKPKIDTKRIRGLRIRGEKSKVDINWLTKRGEKSKKVKAVLCMFIC